MRATVDESCSLSSRSVRSWFFRGPSFCKNVDAYSPAPKSASTSSCSSYRSSFHSSASNSLPQDEAVSKPPVPRKRPPGSSRSNSGLSAISRTNSQLQKQYQELQKQCVQTQTPLFASEKKAVVTAAGGYALGLAHRANSTGFLDEVNKDVDNLSQLLENEELYEFLTSPAVLDVKKKSILRTIADEVGFHRYTITFLDGLVEKRRMHLIEDVIREFEEIYNDLTDTHVATVTSAVKIEAAQLAMVARKIKSLSGATNVRAKNVVDPSLIAGFIIKYDNDGSRYIDMSVKGQLDRLASQFKCSGKTGA